jgi:kynurenine formamidase
MIERHFFLAALALAGCAPTTTPPEVEADRLGEWALELSTARVVDLTHPLGEETLFWPGEETGFQLEEIHHGMTEAGFFYAANRFCAPEHGGTHLDAPIHFAEGRQTADQIPVDRLVAPAVVIDVTEQAAADPEYRLTVEDVVAWEERHGEIPRGAIVLLYTGWSDFWPDGQRYFGTDDPTQARDLRFPSYGEAAAALLVEEWGVAALGVDTASIDYGPSQDFPVHRLAAEVDVPGLENLTGLGELPPTGAWVAALPMKIAGGSGAPLRAVALVPAREGEPIAAAGEGEP